MLLCGLLVLLFLSVDSCAGRSPAKYPAPPPAPRLPVGTALGSGKRVRVRFEHVWLDPTDRTKARCEIIAQSWDAKTGELVCTCGPIPPPAMTLPPAPPR